AYRIYPAIQERSKIGLTGEIVFVDKTGLALRDVRYEPGSAFRKVIRAEPAQAAAAGVRGIRVSRDYRGVPVVAAVGHVPATGWGIVVKQDAAEAYGPAMWLAAIWLVLVGLLVPVAVRSARRLSARFLQPVEELALATHRIAQGDLHTSVPEHRDDELGALVSDFNLMAVQIAASQHALQQSEEAFRSLFEQAAVGVAQVGLDGRFLRVNQRLCDIVGYTEGELRGRTFQDITHPDDLDTDLEYVRQVLAGEIATYSMEKRYFRKEGALVWINLTVNLVRNEAGDPRFFVSVVEDISARRAAQEDLERRNADRGVMIALLRLVGEAPEPHALAEQVCRLLHEWSGCEAVGIRWRQGDDYPYFEVRGFPDDFVELENSLCQRDEAGEIIRDNRGLPALECMCGNILRGRTNPDLPFFTPGGSFWANNTTRLLATTTDADRQAKTRNRCNGEGYESVALIPLRYGGTTYGLLQLNDKRPDRFTAEGIAYLERMADSIALGLARHEAETDLRASEARYRSLFEGMIEGYAYCEIIRDNAGRPIDFVYLAVNPAFAELTGYVDVVGKRVSEVIPGVLEAAPEMFERYGRVAQTGEPDAWEFYFPPNDRWFAAGVYSQEPEHFVVVFDNITARKHAEASLRESEARYRTIGEVMPHGTFMADRDGRQVYLSPSFLDLIGMDMATAQQTDWRSLIHPDDCESSRRAWQVATAGRSFFTNEYRIRGRDGAYHWVLSRGVPLLDETGEVEQWVGVNIDIDDLKAAQASLAESEARYRLLFENMLNGFALHEMIFDDDGRPADYRFLEVNAAFETMTGLDRAAAIGKTVRELLPGLEPEWVETYGQVTLTGEPTRFEQYSASLGRWFSVLAFSPQRGQFATVVEDITDRRRAEEALAAI
ncbi:MAG: PAS domain S-box protein, partial [Armatimonadetes bacterium]|nr:PAS domain S-box protein [Armatimonadota bacterium]